MNIRVNGQLKVLEKSLNLETFLSELNIRKEAVVCELNRSIVDKASYDDTYLNDNDSLEIVHFVGGG